MDEVSIRCMGCSQIHVLADAVKMSWSMCGHCSFAICSFCRDHLDEQQHCLSHVCSQRKRIFDPVPLPVEKILIFARENEFEEYRQGLLFKLFYQGEENQGTAPFFSIQHRGQEIEEDLEKPTKIQEEIWGNSQIVITKRKGGKFITWERVL